MINNTESKKLYKVQSGVTEYPIGFPFQFNSDGVPQLAVTIGTTYLQLNYNCKLSEDNGTLILIPTEEEAETLTGPEDYSWMDKWVDAPLVITRDIPFVQESDYQVGRISPEQIEKDFDASVMRDQILLDKIGEHTTDVSAELESLHTDISDINAELATKATKAELDNYKLTANAAIDANATAIQKTREDYISADSEIHKILNDHTKRLDTLRTDHDDLGDDVADIQAKIPESASESNPLITKQQLLDKETGIRDDMNQSDSELQTQITAQAAAIATKQDKLTAGDNIIISDNVISATGAGGGAGFDVIVVQELPATGQKGIIYLLAKDGEAPDVYDEYVWITTTQTFELIGSTKVDLSNYLPLSGGTLTGSLSFKGGLREYEIRPTAYGNLEFFIDGTKTIDLEANVGLLPNGKGVYSLGRVGRTWKNVYTAKLNNGADLAIPTEGGTLARLEDLEGLGGLPDQTDNAGKFLTTDGTTASWSDKPLVNTADAGTSITIGGNKTTTLTAINIGWNSSCLGESSVVLGATAAANSKNASRAVVIGMNSTVTKKRGIAIGSLVSAEAEFAIQLGGDSFAKNTDANTFKVGNANGNFTMMSADGTIPADRMSATAGITGQVLTKTDAGMEWQEPSGGTTITLKEYDE